MRISTRLLAAFIGPELYRDRVRVIFVGLFPRRDLTCPYEQLLCLLRFELTWRPGAWRQWSLRSDAALIADRLGMRAGVWSNDPLIKNFRASREWMLENRA